MGFVNSESVSSFVSCNNASKSLNSCRLFPVRIILSKFGRNSCKLSASRLQLNGQINKENICGSQWETHTMRLLFSSKHFIRGKYGKPSSRRISLSEKSIVSNWSSVAPIFSICGILYPTQRNKMYREIYFSDNITFKIILFKKKLSLLIYLANPIHDRGTDLCTASMNLSIRALIWPFCVG